MASSRTRSKRCAAILGIAAICLFGIAGCLDTSTGGGEVTVEVETATLAAASPTIAAPTVEPVTTLLFTGDIIPARCSLAAMRRSGDVTSTFDPLQEMLTGADITVGTLDSTVSNVAEPYGCIQTFNLAGDGDFVDALTSGGFDVISHAANHIKDCGTIACGDQAMYETRFLLESAGIAVTGTAGNRADARKPAIVERDGARFAFLAYDDIAAYYHASATTAGSAPLDAATVGDDVRTAKSVADVVVVLPHWGVEYVSVPNNEQRAFAQAAAAAGADLVVGNHPHWVQGYETIDGMFVAYALGNFVFDQDWSLETLQGAMLSVTFTGTTMTSSEYTPVHIYDEYQPRVAPPEEAAQIMRRIEDAATTIAGDAP